MSKLEPNPFSSSRIHPGSRVRSFRVCALVAWVLLLALGCERAPSIDEVRKLQATGRYAETIEPLRKHLEIEPDDSEAHLLYGTALSRTGSARTAVWALRRAAEDDLWKLPALLELSSAAVRSGNWSEAIAVANEVLEIEPDNLPAHILRGEAHLGEAKDPELALEDFEFVLDGDPTNNVALASKASALLLAERPEEAAEVIDTLEAMAQRSSLDDDTRAQLCATRAVLSQELGDLEAADERFSACLEQYPAAAAVLSPAVAYYDERRQSDRGTQILEKALEIEPGAQAYRRALSQRIVAAGDDARALAILEAGVEVESAYARSEAWTDLTNFHLERDDLPAAIDAYEEALALEEDPPALAILSHADMLARAGRNQDALRVAKTLANDAYRGLIEARVLLNEDHPKEALARLDEVFPTWPNNAGARYYAARAAEQLGNFARAIEEYRQSIRSAPDQTEAALRLARLYLAVGAQHDAVSAAGQYVTVHPTDPEGVRVLFRAAAASKESEVREMSGMLRASPLWPVVVATRAQTSAEGAGTAAGLALIEEQARDLDLTLPANAELLRAKVVLLLAAERKREAAQAVEDALAVHPENADFLEIKAAWLEAKGEDPAAVQAAYEHAVAQDATHWRALESLGRLQENQGNTQAALALYDRATLAYPESPSAARRGGELANRSGMEKAAAARWLDLLREHPWDGAAAAALAGLRLKEGISDDVTLELAERAVLFKAGSEAQKQLIAVLEARGDQARAQEVSQAIEAGKPIPPRKAATVHPAGSAESPTKPPTEPPTRPSTANSTPSTGTRAGGPG